MTAAALARPRRYSGAPAAARAELLASLDESYAAWAAQLAEPEWEAIYSYTMVSYSSVNGLLRDWQTHLLVHEDGRERARARTRLLDRALASASTPVALRVYRGVKDARFADPHALIGEVLTDPGFLSVSLDVTVARKFCRPYHEWDYREGANTPAALLEIELPTGVPAGLLTAAIRSRSGVSRNRHLHELELLLPRDMQLEVTDCRRRGNGLPRLSCRLHSV